jgi:RHS repeat-associated protein
LRNRYEYDAFGSLNSSMAGATDDSRYRYTGREFDSETGLHYYRARYFDSNSGRFIGQDPIGFRAGDSNLYRYVFNNSVSATDPTGLLVQAKYSISTRRLTITDMDTKETIEIDGVFSGSGKKQNNVEFESEYGGPIPTGRYEILEGPYNINQLTSWYRLDPIDSQPRNDIDDLHGRSAYRLHPGRRSDGCVTIPIDNANRDWLGKIKPLLDKTQKETDSDNVKLSKIQKLQQLGDELFPTLVGTPNREIVRYGYLQVSEN